MTSVLLVCMGNICRSPTAEAVLSYHAQLRQLGRALRIDSAGTHAYHEGERPDPRAQRIAARRGFDMSRLRARGIDPEDFKEFDLILAMDRDNLASLTRRCPPEHRDKLELFTRYSRVYQDRDVPDPYYGGDAGFERVLDMIEDAALGLLDHLQGRR